MIRAPAAAIDKVIARHAPVRQSVDNGWPHLCLQEGDMQQPRAAGRWQALAWAAQPWRRNLGDVTWAE